MEDHKLDSLEMSKKRDRKVMITEEAINKVPYIEYREIPKEEYEIIYRLTKQVLQLSKEENDSNEVAITYSFDSDKAISQEEVVGVQFGDEHSVNPLADALTYHLIMSSKECMVELLNQTIQKYNESTDLKGYQEATRFFISNCYKAGIIYEDR